MVFRGAPEELTAKSYNHYIFYCNNIIASVRVKNPRHVTLFYASRAKKLLGKMFKLNPGFDWLEKEIASHASHVRLSKCRVKPRNLASTHIYYSMYPTCQLRISSFNFGIATSSSFSSQGSTIVVRPYIDSQPTKCCTRCRKDFPETSVYFKAFKREGWLLCVFIARLKILLRKGRKNNVHKGSSLQKAMAERERCWASWAQMCGHQAIRIQKP